MTFGWQALTTLRQVWQWKPCPAYACVLSSSGADCYCPIFFPNNSENMGRPKKYIALRRKMARERAKVLLAARMQRQQPAPPLPPPPPPPVAAVSDTPGATQAQTVSVKRKRLVTVEKEEPQRSMKFRGMVDLVSVERLVRNVLCAKCATNRLTMELKHHHNNTFMRVKCKCGHVATDIL